MTLLSMQASAAGLETYHQNLTGLNFIIAIVSNQPILKICLAVSSCQKGYLLKTRKKKWKQFKWNFMKLLVHAVCLLQACSTRSGYIRVVSRFEFQMDIDHSK